VKFLTADLPGTGGVIRHSPEDFEVHEVPAYLPSGKGEHLFLHVQKRGLSTPELARRIARALELDAREVSWAGLKDRHAVTTQWLSVPAVKSEPKLSQFSDPAATVLEAKRHDNKLRNGHLRGNRFALTIRDAKNPQAAEAVFEALKVRGVANYFGEQRFGVAGDNAEQGRLILKGERLAKKPDRFERKLFLSAFQSMLFNRALDARLDAGTLAKALKGDVLKKTDTGGLFVCEEPEVDQARVDRAELSAAGPIFGPKMTAAKYEVHEAELKLLADAGVTMDDFRRGRDETEGTRRLYRIMLGEPTLSVEGSTVKLAFTLPRGSYATVVLGELMKAASSIDESDE
jgi:tRNA pseudouridine13 synthase